MLKNIIKLFVLLLFTVQSKASEAVISGVVHDSNSHPLAGATVEIVNSADSTKTDDNGRFKINYTPSDLKIKISKGGYIPHFVKLSLFTKDHYRLKDTYLTKIPAASGFFIKQNHHLVRLKRDELLIEDAFQDEKINKYEYRYAGVKYPNNNVRRPDESIFFYGEFAKIANLKIYKLSYLDSLSVFFGSRTEPPSFADIDMWTVDKAQLIAFTLKRNNQIQGMTEIQLLDRLEPFGRYLLTTKDIKKVMSDSYSTHFGYMVTQLPINYKLNNNEENSDIPIKQISGAYLGVKTGASGYGYFTILDENTNEKMEVVPREKTQWFLNKETVSVSCDGGCWPDLPESAIGCYAVLEETISEMVINVSSKNCNYKNKQQEKIFKFRDTVIKLIKENRCSEIKKTISSARYNCTKKQNKKILKALKFISSNNYARYVWEQYQYESSDQFVGVRKSKKNKYGYELEFSWQVLE